MRFAILCLLAASTAWSLPAQATQFEPSPQGLAVGATVSALDVGDVDLDGDLDVVAFEAFVGVQLLRNDGRGNFRAELLPFVPPAFSFSTVPVFIDFDGDADLDVFISEQSGRALLRNDGNGVWVDVSAGLPALVPVARAYVADFDGDGDQDIACTGRAIVGSYNQMLVNMGGGTFTVRTPFSGFFGFTIDAADIDGDGDLDLAVPEVSPKVWRNDGGMVFTDITATSLPAWPTTPSLSTFGDVDGDGDPDLVVGTTSGDDRVLINDGTGVFTELPMAAPQGLGSTQAISLEDVDQDGDLDLIRGTVFHPLTVARNDGLGVFTNEPNAYPAGTPSTRYVLVGDFDGDLDVDVFASESSVAPQLFLNNHRQLRSSAPLLLGQVWTVDVLSQPGYAAGPRAVQLGVALSLLQQPVQLVPAGALWLDPAQPILRMNSLLPPGASVASIAIAVPPLPSLVGLDVHAQAAVQESLAADGLRLTPPLSATIQ